MEDPPTWAVLYRDALSTSKHSALRSAAARLATLFGDQEAIAQMRAVVLDRDRPLDERRVALRALLDVGDGVSVSLLHDLVRGSSDLRAESIRALARYNDAETPKVLLDLYADLSVAERQAALGILATRLAFAESFLSAVEKGRVERQDVSVFVLQNLRQFQNPALEKRIQTLWKDDAQALEKSAQIALYKRKMSPAFLKSGNAQRGRVVYEQTCARCHVLFGEGNDVGPDLTGSGRKDIDYVLTNLVDPNATIDAAFRLTTVLTNDGQLFNGFLIHQDDTSVDMRTQETRIRLGMDDVLDISTSNQSMMPEGMLASFTDEQVRDLLVYLASTEQVALPKSR